MENKSNDRKKKEKEDVLPIKEIGWRGMEGKCMKLDKVNGAGKVRRSDGETMEG